MSCPTVFSFCTPVIPFQLIVSSVPITSKLQVEKVVYPHAKESHLGGGGMGCSVRWIRDASAMSVEERVLYPGLVRVRRQISGQQCAREWARAFMWPATARKTRGRGRWVRSARVQRSEEAMKLAGKRMTRQVCGVFVFKEARKSVAWTMVRNSGWYVRSLAGAGWSSWVDHRSRRYLMRSEKVRWIPGVGVGVGAGGLSTVVREETLLLCIEPSFA
jgi:hypothetical protein